MVARLFGCLVLFALSVKSLLGCQRNPPGMIDTPFKNLFVGCPEAFMTVTFFYSSVMAIVSVTVKDWSVSATRYNILVLLSVFGVYLYRDIWPLATFTEEPKDLQEGYMFWVKFSIVTLTAVIIPLFIPRQYVPVDPKDPMPEPNPEQTCSLFALVFFTYLDPVILLGYRVPHLRFDQLPPLSDSDYAKHITRDAFPHLDPYSGAKRKHLFFGLMRVFRVEYMILSVCLIGQTFAIFAAPIGLNKLLNYLETGGADAFIRPWFWILWLLAGPIVKDICFQWYFFISSRTLVRTEGLLTQLVFEHSLRIRLKAEASNREDDILAISASESASVAESKTIDSNSDERTSEPCEASTTVSRDSSSDSQSTSNVHVKGKDKDDPSTSKNNAKHASKGKKDAQNLIGKINNLVTTDLGNIVDGRNFLIIILNIPLQILLSTVFLYKVLGWSAFVGLVTMLLLYPVPGYIAKRSQDVQVQRMKMMDARVQDVTEVVKVLRMIKLFGWEKRMSERIQEKRNDELRWLWKLKVLETLNWITNNMIPTIVMLVTYATHTVLMKQELTPSKIFSSMTVFSLLKLQLQRLSLQISSAIQAKVSLDRMTEFLHKTELLDSFADKPSHMVDVPTTIERENDIGFKNATFSWSVESPSDSSIPSNRAFQLHISGEQLFKRDCINLIIGPTGSGKTSMLMALLGEMHFIPSTADAWFNLPRNGGVAYAAQESWVQNDTIRNNILFGSTYDEVRYRKVLHQCALERDLELFDAGDSTEVGELGLTLSGGQKARLTLARAIYSSAEILLLDDILAALDVHTSSWIIDRCLQGDLVKGRTVVLVTHNVALAVPIAQHVVSIGQDGTVRSYGVEHLDDVLPNLNDLSLASEHVPGTVVEEVKHIIKKDHPTDGKLVMSEEIAKGHVTWKSMKLFLSGLGGDYPLFFFSVWISATLLTDWMNTFQVWFLGYWGSKYETHAPSEVNASFYLTQYSLILFSILVIYTATNIFYWYGTLRASRRISASLVDSVLGSTLRWLDETPTGRIISRCTQDIRAIDGPIPLQFIILTEVGISMLTKLVVIVIITPIFAFPGMVVAISGVCLGNIYLRAQLSVKREMSNARSPLLAHFNAAVAGIVSIRAYGAQVPFKTESLARVNHYIRVARVSYNLVRWITVRIDMLGAIFTAALASYLVYGHSVGAGNTGFSLNMVLEFCTAIFWWVTCFNDFEVQSNSLERIQGYIDIEHEPEATESGKPPAAWPTSGDLRIENLSARYSQTGPAVLHNISFHIKSGQRIGVVGRTGSGKSSLTLALLRCILTEGTVYYDGIPTEHINLDALRSNITIIPQTPELLSGTLRRNLDPFEEHDDATLNDALRAAGLFSLQEEMEEARLTLDSNMASGGGNLSVGQRQIITLARAMVRKSKLLILDEATSAIDYKTDSIIQATLRHQMNSDVTIITVAHRLQTIMDADKIMVLDDGRIAEFDSPKALLHKTDGFLKSLVDGSGDKEALYAMALTDRQIERSAEI
ncbi:multidrug resistance-associated ABC transporter [Phlegmacium glaucopus]|nr:multidrug resistance-associated ABC transporter [Phlegmacium glaucopus]